MIQYQFFTNHTPNPLRTQEQNLTVYVLAAQYNGRMEYSQSRMKYNSHGRMRYFHSRPTFSRRLHKQNQQ
jgi:hypothetical protein